MPGKIKPSNEKGEHFQRNQNFIRSSNSQLFVKAVEWAFSIQRLMDYQRLHLPQPSSAPSVSTQAQGSARGPGWILCHKAPSQQSDLAICETLAAERNKQGPRFQLFEVESQSIHVWRPCRHPFSDARWMATWASRNGYFFWLWCTLTKWLGPNWAPQGIQTV